MPPLTFLKIFDVVPGWVYAAAIVLLLLLVGADRIEIADARRDAAVEKALLEGDRAAAASALQERTALVLKVTNDLHSERLAQEKRDGDAQATIAQLGEDLRRSSRAGGGAGLRDPNARSCDAAHAGSGPAAAAGAGDAAAAGGVLSAPLEGLLLELTGKADVLNDAYASCRSDAVTMREKLKELQSPGSSPGSASAGPP